MDKIETYRGYIKQLITECSQYKPFETGNVRAMLVLHYSPDEARQFGHLRLYDQEAALRIHVKNATLSRNRRGGV